MTVTIGPFTDVPAPGDPIRSAWAQNTATYITNNTVRREVAGTQTVASGLTIVGNVQTGGSPAANAAGLDTRADGIILSRVNPASLTQASLGLERAGANSVANSVFVSFRRGATAGAAVVECGSITVNAGSSGVVYNTSSDRRLKEDHGLITGALERLGLLQPRRIVWKGDETQTEMDGFIADEVTAAVPEAVTGEPDALDENGNISAQKLDVPGLVPLLVAAVQELAARLAALEAG